jgi:hypothetical protein
MFNLADYINVTDDSVSYAAAKLAHLRNRWVSFAAPDSVVEMFKRQKREAEGLVVSGIYCGTRKVGPNYKCEFYHPWSGLGVNDPDWIIILRDVMVKSPSGASEPFFPTRNRSSNKKRLYEFSFKELSAAALSTQTGV